MDRQRFVRIDEIFSAAAERVAAERPAFLELACGGDAELRRAVEELLAAEGEAERLFHQPAGRPPAGWEALDSPPPEDAERRAAAAALGSRVGRIRLQKLIGVGGMGAVFAGFDEGLGRRVAVKRLRHDRHDTDLRRRLRQEARLLSRLNHPNICQIYDLVEGDEHDHLVLELIEGKTLRQVIGEGPDRRLALRIAEEIAAALAAAHAEGIVHRDLKPENVMITGAPAARRVKVLDFGVARPAEMGEEPEAPPAGSAVWKASSLTPRDSLIGTPRYMSPEQARGEPATTASDLYSFGLVLLELVTGRSLRGLGDRGGLQELASRRVRGQLGILIGRLLSVAPAARPTAFDTLERLRWIRGAARRRFRRRLAAAAGALLVLFAAAMGYLAHEAGRQARHATAQRLTAQATLHLEGQLDLALLLSLEAQRMADLPETRSALRNALETSPRLRRYLHAHRRSVSGVVWSRDGQTLASAGTMDGSVRLWNTSDGSIETEFDTGQGGILAIAWQAGDRLLATGGMDGTIRLWDPVTGSPRGVLRGHEMNLWALAWHPGGRLLASASQDQTVRLWDVEAGTCLAVLRGHHDAVWAVAWSGDGELLASAGGDATVRLWDADGHPRGAPLSGHRGAVVGLAWSGDGRLLASASRDRTIRLWDPFRGTSAGAPLRAYEKPLEKLAWSKTRALLAAGTDSGQVQLWDPARRRPVGEPLAGQSGGITGLAWSHDGTALVSASRDRSIALWNLGDLGRTGPLEGHQAGVTQLAVSPDGRTLASAGWDQTLRLWDRASGRPLGEPMKGHTGAVFGLAWSADSRFLATGGIDWTLRVWDAAAGTEVAVLRGHEGVVAEVAWSADGSTIASASWDGTIGLWDVGERRLRRRLEGQGGRVGHLAWRAGEGLLATGGAEGVVRLWTARGEPAGEIAPGGGEVLGLAWHGGRLAVLTEGKAQVWDTASGTLLTTLAGAEEARSSPVWNRDGTLLAADGPEIHLWDAGTGELLARFSSHRGTVLSLAWSPDGLLYSGGIDGTIRLREAGVEADTLRERACRRAGRNLTPEEWKLYLGPGVAYRRTCPGLPQSTSAQGSDGTSITARRTTRR